LSAAVGSGSNRRMDLHTGLRSRIRRARKRDALWVRFLDALRLAATAEGRGQLWTRIAHGAELHQTTPFTLEERYPELFDLAARLCPNARRILSFGCSTGEELVALRRRFPSAVIIGAEINSRSRRIAKKRVANDSQAEVVAPGEVPGRFDLVFALAVLQREPKWIEDMEIDDLSFHYPFDRFDKAVRELVDRLETGGLLCVSNTHYPIEASSAFGQLETVANSPLLDPPLFGRDSRRLADPVARTIFRKRS
jgi:SAM-dependent methyltransferase